MSIKINIKQLLVVCVYLLSVNVIFAETLVDFASSPNPVGSGARAIGMGGAFIAIADDATSASWNPAGLCQLESSEFSIVGNFTHMIEDIFPSITLGAKGKQSIDRNDLNYLSMSTRFKVLERFMVVSINYQKLYYFNKEWDFPISMKGIELPMFGTADISGEQSLYQDGSLSAIGLAWSVQWSPKIAIGMTLNVWDDEICNNKWKEENTLKNAGMYVDMFGIKDFMPIEDASVSDEYSFDGVNINFGIMWKPTDDFTFGFVFKSPFKADIEHSKYEDDSFLGNEKENMKIPASYGIGVAYNFSDSFRMSADIYRTDWQNFISIDSNGQETSPVTKMSANDSEVDQTTQLRLGAEYLFINQQKRFLIPLRAGLFYDPSPSNGSPDDYWGFSLGSGFMQGRYMFDIAYQARFGNDVGDSIVPGHNFSMDVEEHQLFFSFIVHFNELKKKG